MALPDISAPEKGQPHAGKVLIDGIPYSPADAGSFARALDELATFAYTQGTRTGTVAPEAMAALGLYLAQRGAWEGTFASALQTMLTDVLEDQAPVELIVHAFVDGGDEVFHGQLVAYETEGEKGHQLRFEDGFTLPAVDIRAVTLVD